LGTSFLFGPRLNLQRFDYFVPFAEFSGRRSHAGAQMTGDSSQSAFALAAGGRCGRRPDQAPGLEVPRQIDYLMTNFSGLQRRRKTRGRTIFV